MTTINTNTSETIDGASPSIDPIRVDVWSDIACPWCYIGKRKFENAVAKSGIPVEVVYRSYELAPDLPEEFEGSERDYLTLRGYADEEMEPLMDRIVGAAKVEGLKFDYEILRHTNMMKGHELLHFARSKGCQLAMVERILAAHFEEGRHVGRDEDLADLAAEVGLDREQALAALQDRRFQESVRADEAQARELGIQGVPYYLFEGKYGVSGAQSADTFAGILRQMVDKRNEVAE